MTKSAFIAIVGCPNVGKSSILNHLLGVKIAIVSEKPQTTRTRIMGVLTEGDTQLVFTDTPGFHRPRTKLGEKMIAEGNAVPGETIEFDTSAYPSGEYRFEARAFDRDAYGNDIEETAALREAAAYFDISLVDHLIIAGNKYYSFSDEI